MSATITEAYWPLSDKSLACQIGSPVALKTAARVPFDPPGGNTTRPAATNRDSEKPHSGREPPKSLIKSLRQRSFPPVSKQPNSPHCPRAKMSWPLIVGVARGPLKPPQPDRKST